MHRYRGLLVIALWQAPLGPAIAPDGSVTFLLGAGSDEFTVFSCEGELIDAARVKYRVAGVEFDHDIGSRLRVQATAGLLFSDIDAYDGPFGGAALRADWRHIGLGAGVVTAADVSEPATAGVYPSAHVRIGTDAAAHLRFDLLPLNVQAPQQVARLGIGYNAIDRRRPAVFVGVAGLGRDEGVIGGALDLDLPVSGAVGFSLRAHASPGHAYPVYGAAVGARLVFD